MDAADACQTLHLIAERLPVVSYPFQPTDLPRDGIYFFYETGETWGHGEPPRARIVRVGTHREGNFRSRMADHYLVGRKAEVQRDRPAPKDRSIFRKNLGRALLARTNDPYLPMWEIDFTTRAKRDALGERRNLVKEQSLEDEISRLLRERFVFRCLPMSGEEERMGGSGLEAKLIGTLARCTRCRPSDGWLGRYSPKPEIRRSGLWLSQHLSSEPLTAADLTDVETRTAAIRGWTAEP